MTLESGSQDLRNFFQPLLDVDAANTMCIDCGKEIDMDFKGADSRGINNGCYFCMNCSGIHRSVGVHLSFVKSTVQDNWRPEHRRMMEAGGNHLISRFLNANGIDPRMPIKEKYQTVPAVAYRVILRATAHKLTIPDEASALAAGQEVLDSAWKMDTEKAVARAIALTEQNKTAQAARAMAARLEAEQEEQAHERVKAAQEAEARANEREVQARTRAAEAARERSAAQDDVVAEGALDADASLGSLAPDHDDEAEGALDDDASLGSLAPDHDDEAEGALDAEDDDGDDVSLGSLAPDDIVGAENDEASLGSPRGEDPKDPDSDDWVSEDEEPASPLPEVWGTPAERGPADDSLGSLAPDHEDSDEGFEVEDLEETPKEQAAGDESAEQSLAVTTSKAPDLETAVANAQSAYEEAKAARAPLAEIQAAKQAWKAAQAAAMAEKAQVSEEEQSLREQKEKEKERQERARMENEQKEVEKQEKTKEEREHKKKEERARKEREIQRKKSEEQIAAQKQGNHEHLEAKRAKPEQAIQWKGQAEQVKVPTEQKKPKDRDRGNEVVADRDVESRHDQDQEQKQKVHRAIEKRDARKQRTPAKPQSEAVQKPEVEAVATRLIGKRRAPKASTPKGGAKLGAAAANKTDTNSANKTDTNSANSTREGTEQTTHRTSSNRNTATKRALSAKDLKYIQRQMYVSSSTSSSRHSERRKSIEGGQAEQGVNNSSASPTRVPLSMKELKQIQQIMLSSPCTKTGADMRKLFNVADRDMGGTLDFAEFARGIRRGEITPAMLPTEQLKGLFMTIDVDSIGSVEVDELAHFVDVKLPDPAAKASSRDKGATRARSPTKRGRPAPSTKPRVKADSSLGGQQRAMGESPKQVQKRRGPRGGQPPRHLRGEASIGKAGEGRQGEGGSQRERAAHVGEDLEVQYRCRYKCGYWGLLADLGQHEACCVGKLRHTVMCGPPHDAQSDMMSPDMHHMSLRHSTRGGTRRSEHMAQISQSVLFNAMSPELRKVYVGQDAITFPAQSVEMVGANLVSHILGDEKSRAPPVEVEELDMSTEAYLDAIWSYKEPRF